MANSNYLKKNAVFLFIALVLLMLPSLAFAELSCDMKVDSWGNGYVLHLNIKNEGTNAIEEWSMNLDFNQAPNPVDIWNTELSISGNTVIAENMHYNGHLQPGQNTYFGFRGTHNGNFKDPVISFDDPTNSDKIVIQENETGFWSVDGSIDNNHSGYTGSGFANTVNASGKTVQYGVSVPSEGGTYNLEIRYASTSNRMANIVVDGITIGSFNFPSTNSWTNWKIDTANIELSGGPHCICIEAISSKGLPNIDSLTVKGNKPVAIEKEVYPETGYLTGYIIEGLKYTTETQIGTTDQNGMFKYINGETITFSVGDIQIGETITAKGNITLLDLLPGTLLYTTTGEIRNIYQKGRLSIMRLNFNKFTNSLIFLETLDEDTNSANGIKIPSEVSSMFTGVAIDFKDEVEKFSQNFSIRSVVIPASKNGLLRTGAICKPGKALDNYYKAQGIVHQISIIDKSNFDSDGNGEYDEIKTHIFDSNFNKINQTVWALDSDDLWYPRQISNNTYDTNDNLLKTEYDNNNDGIPDSISIFTYDDNHYLLTSSIDRDGDNVPDYKTTYIYNPQNGNLDSNYIDTNADGIYDLIIQHTYDIKGNLILTQEDREGDTVLDRIIRRSYDPKGNLIKYVEDKDGDGTSDFIIQFAYDEYNNEIENKYDYDADGVIDSNSSCAYNFYGQLLVERTDSNGDGNVDRVNKITYFPSGLLKKSSIDEDMDGNPDRIIHKTYDSAGNMLTLGKDSNGDGILNDINTYEYDEYGNRLKYTHDRGADGNIDFSYDDSHILANWSATLKLYIQF